MSDPRTDAWQVLRSRPEATLCELFALDPQRVASLSGRIDTGEGEVLFDWSKTHLTEELLADFEALAEAAGFAEMRRKLFAGEVVNQTEDRAAEHSALRGVGKEASVEEAMALAARMKLLVEVIHDGAIAGSRSTPRLKRCSIPYRKDCRRSSWPHASDHKSPALTG